MTTRLYAYNPEPFDEKHHAAIEVGTTETDGAGVLILWQNLFDDGTVQLLSLSVTDVEVLADIPDLIQRLAAWQRANPSAPSLEQVCVWMDELGFEK